MKNEDWFKRIQSRNDIAARLTHLTRANETMNAFEVLMKILNDKKLLGSTTHSGFIVGNTPAVCLQETPLESLAEHIIFENESFSTIDKQNVRYSGIGLRFNKLYIYRKGGRPVIYDKKEYLKNILPEELYWRIVNFDLDNLENCIDWTHEREWRVPNELAFNYNNIELIFPDSDTYRRFILYCEENNTINLLKEIRGIVILSSTIY